MSLMDDVIEREKQLRKAKAIKEGQEPKLGMATKVESPPASLPGKLPFKSMPKNTSAQSLPKHQFQCRCGYKFSLDAGNHPTLKCPWCSAPLKIPKK